MDIDLPAQDNIDLLCFAGSTPVNGFPRARGCQSTVACAFDFISSIVPVRYLDELPRKIEAQSLKP